MTPPPIRLNFDDAVGPILDVLLEPYKTFIARLHADGRITDAEIAALTTELLDRRQRLGPLLMERARQRSPDQGPEPG